MRNLQLIERQPHWRVAVIHYLARLIGVMVHVEGIPFGSNRTYRRPNAESMGAQQACSPMPALPQASGKE